MSQARLAAFDAGSGDFLSSFRPEISRPVLALEASNDGGLFVAGEVGTYNGTSVGSLVKVDPQTGDIWPGWQTTISNGGAGANIVRDVSLELDGWLYAVGSFRQVSDQNGTVAVSNAIRMDPETGIVDRSWTPEISGGSVWGVSASRTTSSVYLAGWKLTVNGATNSVVGVNASDGNTNTWTGFQLNFRCCDNMYDVEATEFGTVLIVGEQHYAVMYDETDMSILYSHVTSFDSRFQDSDVRRGGDYQEIERVGNSLYATCHCWGSHSSVAGGIAAYGRDLATVEATPTGSVSGLVAYNAQTGIRDQSINPYMAGDIGGFGLLEDSQGCIWIAGGINAVGPIGNQRPGRDLVRLCDG